MENLYGLLKPGGTICFRDYGRYDMTQLRFKKERLLDDNFYIRGDGTRVYFFEEGAPLNPSTPHPPAPSSPPWGCCQWTGLTVAELEEMFSDFVIEQLLVDRRLLVNRQNLKKMYRVWYQGRFRKRKEGEQETGNTKEGQERGVRDVDETSE